MKKYIFFIIITIKLSNNLFSQINNNQFTITDSTTLFSKVDSLKKDEHTEFALSMFSVVYNNRDELDLILNKFRNSVFPEGYVLYHLNNTYYPKTEYINDETDKKFNQTFAYIKENSFETIIYLLKPSRSISR